MISTNLLHAPFHLAYNTTHFGYVDIPATSPEKKEHFLNSAIYSLSNDDMLSNSRALAHALVLRGDARLELIPMNVQGAIDDCLRALEIDDVGGRAWRVLADSQEADGKIDEAICSVSRWADANPSFVTKAQKEIARLSSKKP